MQPRNTSSLRQFYQHLRQSLIYGGLSVLLGCLLWLPLQRQMSEWDMTGIGLGIGLGMVLVIWLGILYYRLSQLQQHIADSENSNARLRDELEQAKRHVFQMSSHDFLTGLPNRALFEEIATTGLSRASRTNNLFSLLYLDLDNFKVINEMFGHETGDALLQTVALRLKNGLREYDLISRLGSDKFLILLQEVTTESAITEIATKLLRVISEPYKNLQGRAELQVSCSMGIAVYPRDGKTHQELSDHAQSAMYLAKRSGARFRFYDSQLNAQADKRLELLKHFKQAMLQNEFILHYQPKVDLTTKRITGMEALIRWQHPEQGMIYPGAFIPLAEIHDLIIPLGYWIIDSACKQLAQWRDAGITLVPVAINVSAKQLLDERFTHTFLNTLEKYRLPAWLLEIEVTESCFIDDIATAAAVLHQLCDEGIKVSLDDYGTGYSGLSHIRALPIHALKIDRSFIQNIRHDKNDAMIVASTIMLAKNLGLRVIAEGIETREQMTHLTVIGCHEVQGYYLYRPMPAQQAEVVLREQALHLPHYH